MIILFNVKVKGSSLARVNRIQRPFEQLRLDCDSRGASLCSLVYDKVLEQEADVGIMDKEVKRVPYRGRRKEKGLDCLDSVGTTSSQEPGNYGYATMSDSAESSQKACLKVPV
jgi:hypothetical protein